MEILCHLCRAYDGTFFANQKHLFWCQTDAENLQKQHIDYKYPCWRPLSRSPKARLEVKIGIFYERFLCRPILKAEE
jgi:hypothetical protein